MEDENGSQKSEDGEDYIVNQDEPNKQEVDQ